MTDYEKPTERGAVTLPSLPDGPTYGVAVCDYEQEDGRRLRVVTFMEVHEDGTDHTIFEKEFML